jgi:hypothetical protein
MKFVYKITLARQMRSRIAHQEQLVRWRVMRPIADEFGFASCSISPDLLNEPINQGIYERGCRCGISNDIQIMDVPIYHSIGPSMESRFHKRPMLGLLHRYHQIRAF